MGLRIRRFSQDWPHRLKVYTSCIRMVWSLSSNRKSASAECRPNLARQVHVLKQNAPRTFPRSIIRAGEAQVFRREFGLGLLPCRQGGGSQDDVSMLNVWRLPLLLAFALLLWLSHLLLLLLLLAFAFWLFLLLVAFAFAFALCCLLWLFIIMR